MLVTYKNINKIEFPVYILPSEDWSFSDGLMFLEGKVVDDRNMKGDTLGIRRLQTGYPELLELKKSINSIQGILKQKQKAFIDSKGRPFLYEKTLFCKLRYYKIKKKEGRDGYSLLWLTGVSTPFKVPRPPEDGYIYAGVLLFNSLPWVLYEYSLTAKKDTRRKA